MESGISEARLVLDSMQFLIVVTGDYLKAAGALKSRGKTRLRINNLLVKLKTECAKHWVPYRFGSSKRHRPTCIRRKSLSPRLAIP